MFNVDWRELEEEILPQWEYRRQSQLELNEVALSMDHVIVPEGKSEEIGDFKCCICLGVVRAPLVQCKSCEKVFCDCCFKMVERSNNCEIGIIQAAVLQAPRQISMMDTFAEESEEAPR